MHHLLRNFHLFFEFRIVRHEFDPARNLGGIERIAFIHPQPGKQLLGQDNTGRIADGRNLELHESSPLLLIPL